MSQKLNVGMNEVDYIHNVIMIFNQTNDEYDNSCINVEDTSSVADDTTKGKDHSNRNADKFYSYVFVIYISIQMLK